MRTKVQNIFTRGLEEGKQAGGGSRRRGPPLQRDEAELSAYEDIFAAVGVCWVDVRCHPRIFL